MTKVGPLRLELKFFAHLVNKPSSSSFADLVFLLQRKEKERGYWDLKSPPRQLSMGSLTN